MFRRLCLSAIVSALLCGVAAAADEEKEQASEPQPQAAEAKGTVTIQLMQPPSAEPQQGLYWHQSPFSLMQAIKVGEYWLGVQCHPVDNATLRAQLGLPEDLGVVVDRVEPDSPAAQAALQQHDVLLKAGEKPLKTPQDLLDAVEAAKETELGLELFRGGQKMTTTVTPAKRPKEAYPGRHVPPGGEEAFEAYSQALKFLQQMQPDAGPGDPFRFRVIRPGAILPPGAPIRAPLPGNMSININKEGDQPAKIVVKRDDQTWELTEEDLDKLPEDVRPHVERMLGGISKGPIHRFDFVPDWATPGQAVPKIKARIQSLPDQRLPEKIEQRLQQRMEKMEKQMEQLRKLMEERWEKLAEPVENTPGENQL